MAIPKAVRYFLLVIFISFCVMGVFLYLVLASHNCFWVGVLLLDLVAAITSFLIMLTKKLSENYERKPE